ncbi:PREDICTED: oxysterol-binding protein-related protein 1A isoform X1 [Camelina sativa]|uniref:Oxysterol-binding protein-related protein 1A isoform X1 n=2 Tax=Camelina sativa TaxID=90675 RepID=A0ABM0Z4D2_CAMSA|nr:PREDICTED: oxysterol-binding protein-related protein 1A isoform X1 [Camelina sativa]
MHPFCCVSTVSDHSSSTPLPEQPSFSMYAATTSETPFGSARSQPVITRSASQRYNHPGPSNHHHLLHSLSFNHQNVFVSDQQVLLALPPAAREAPVDVKINDIAGNSISGILYKWVNYGKGWRRRWFVLQDGVLSYYKIHGPDKIVVVRETEKGSRVIGDESTRMISRNNRHAGSSANHQLRRKPFGEVHLKVSSIRESRSDDKRFSIFTGTKRLHLRAETREDRTAWMEALQAVKDMFPRMSNCELMAPTNSLDISIEKLRLRLVEEGVSESAIQDCEQITRSEFSAVQSQLLLLKQKQWLLIDTLRQLETEKVDLENTVVDETQRQTDNGDSGTISESEDDNEQFDEAEEEIDTCDSLSSSSFKSIGSAFRTSFSSDDDGLNNGFESDDDDLDPSIKSIGFNYPHVKRRKRLPDPVEKEKSVSLWSMIKDNIGKDLTKVCLPVYFNEPLSSLQKCFEDLEYSYLLDQASEWGKKGDNLMRILNVAAFAVSGYASTEGRICKPFNPMLGETYEADYPDKGLRFFSEKVSHHPMIVACHCDGTGWKFWGDSNLKSKFWGRSIQLDPIGLLTLKFDDGETLQWSKVTTSIYNLILGKLYCDHYGTMRIEGNGEYSCKLKFKEQSMIDRNPHQVQGVVEDKNGKTVAKLFGKWDESMHYVLVNQGKVSESHLLWKRNKPSENPTKYNLTRFGITLNELTPGLKEKLPPTDSRLRPDQRYLEKGEFEMGNAEKLRLEQRQRQAREMQERGWKPKWFRKEKGSETYKYNGGYWEARDSGRWDDCPDIFGQVHQSIK